MGVAIFIALLVLLRACAHNSSPLQQRFAAAPPVPGNGGKIVLPPLPSSIAELAQTAVAQINGGSGGPALTPIAAGGSLRVTISSLRKTGKTFQIKGTVTNTGTTPLAVSLGNFRFTDGSGTIYTADASAQTTLTPQQEAPLDLNLPIADPRQLVLDVQVPDQPAIHMVLLHAPD